MLLRVIFPALFFASHAWAAVADEGARTTTYQCTHVLKLDAPVRNLQQGFFEHSINWNQFDVPANATLAQGLQISETIGDFVNPIFKVKVLNETSLTVVPCDSLTLSPANLRLLHGMLERGQMKISQFEARAAAVNEYYQMAVDALPDGLPMPIPPNDPRCPLLRHGFAVFSGHGVAYLLANDYGWLAICPQEGIDVDAASLRENTFRFMSNPAVGKILDCQDLLLSKSDKRK